MMLKSRQCTYIVVDVEESSLYVQSCYYADDVLLLQIETRYHDFLPKLVRVYSCHINRC